MNIELGRRPDRSIEDNITMHTTIRICTVNSDVRSDVFRIIIKSNLSSLCSPYCGICHVSMFSVYTDLFIQLFEYIYVYKFVQKSSDPLNLFMIRVPCWNQIYLKSCHARERSKDLQQQLGQKIQILAIVRNKDILRSKRPNIC